ncbi:MAG: SGNH/GDSL hydrolase family protein [Lachnospiraceae bacterium]|nr:SGNH/GDSL hydrolase family protein [Lachnospiraceae bacterium]
MGKEEKAIEKNRKSSMYVFVAYLLVELVAALGTLYKMCNIIPKTAIVEEMENAACNFLIDDFIGVVYPLLVKFGLIAEGRLYIAYYAVIYIIQALLLVAGCVLLMTFVAPTKTQGVALGLGIAWFPLVINKVCGVNPTILRVLLWLFIVSLLLRHGKNREKGLKYEIPVLILWAVSSLNTPQDLYTGIVFLVLVALYENIGKFNKIKGMAGMSIRAFVVFIALFIVQKLCFIPKVRGREPKTFLFNVSAMVVGIVIFIIFVLIHRLSKFIEKYAKECDVDTEEPLRINLKLIISVCVVGILVFSGVKIKNMIMDNHYTKIAKETYKGTKIVVFGDSIWGKEQDETGIASIVAGELDADIVNCAINGSSTAPGDPEIVSLHEILCALCKRGYDKENETLNNLVAANPLEGADYIVVEYGINDYFSGRQALGSNESTYKVNLANCVKMLLYTNQDSTIIVTSPTYTQEYSNGIISGDSNTVDLGGGVGKDYVRACEEIGQEVKGSVEFINMYDTLGINRHNGARYLEDAVHLNALGRKKYAQKFIVGLGKIVKKKKSGD